MAYMDEYYARRRKRDAKTKVTRALPATSSAGMKQAAAREEADIEQNKVYRSGPPTRAKIRGVKGMSKVRPKGRDDDKAKAETVESTPLKRPSGEISTSVPKTSPRPKSREDRKKKRRGAYNEDFNTSAVWGR